MNELTAESLADDTLAEFEKICRHCVPEEEQRIVPGLIQREMGTREELVAKINTGIANGYSLALQASLLETAKIFARSKLASTE